MTEENPVLHVIRNRTVDLLLSSVSLFLEPQLHIEDKSFSRMLWPNSSVSREVSDSPRDNTDISLHASRVCILHLQANVYIYRYGTDARALTFPPPHFPLLSITRMECQCGINSGDDVLILNDGILNDVLILNVQHFLALFFHHLMM